METIETYTFESRMADERSRQIRKWGEQTHSGHAWIAILVEEVGEFAKAVNEEKLSGALDELVQIAAVAKAAWEMATEKRGILEPIWGECLQTPADADLTTTPD